MKALISSPARYGFMLLGLLCFLAAAPAPHASSSPEPLRAAAFRILETKCNSCHRKQNPFMVFRENKLDKRADRIYRAVFLQRRMPKPAGTPLTPAEADTLRQWLETKID